MARPSGVALLASHTRNVSGALLRTDYAVAGNAARARYVYDQLGRVETYDVFAKVGSGAYAHRASQHATYSASDDVLSAVSRVAGTAPRNIAYDYDGRHQLVAVSDDQDFSAVYEYGAAGRLTDAHVAATNAPIAHPRTVTYQYRTPGDGVVADLEAPIALLRQDGTARARYDYDRAGNLVRRRVGGAVAADPIDEHTFVYDGDQRQRAATAPDGTRQVDYYDSSGSRALQVLKGSGGVVTRVRLWFGPLEVWYTPAGVAEKQWAHVAHGVSIARVEVHPSAPTLGGIQPDAVVGEPSGVEFQFHSQLGHMLVGLNESMHAVGGFQYGPFGEVLAQVGSPDDHLRRFNGKEFDTTTGLSYYGFRHYDPLSMTWTQADPLFRFAPDLAYDQPRNLNLYAFSLNNPMRYVDWDGRRPTGTAANEAGSGGEQSSVRTPYLVHQRLRGRTSGGGMSGRELGVLALQPVPMVGDGAAALNSGLHLISNPSLSTGVDALLDIAGLLPFVPALGTARRVARQAEAVKDGTSATRRRVKLRKRTRKQIEKRQPRNAAGQMVDPNTGNPLKAGKIDVGHKPGQEWRKRKQMHEEAGSTRKQVLDAENDPELYHLEDRSSNRSHAHEAK